MFAGGEILGFDGLLRGRDALGDHLAFDRHIFFHAEAQHQVLHAMAAEDAHQVVLQREIKARAAGIALASGAAAQLIIDAAGFVTLRADDVQAAELTTSSCSLTVCALKRAIRVPFLAFRRTDGGSLHDSGSLFSLRKMFLRHELGVSAEQNVGSAAGHVGRDGHRAFASRLRDHGRFPLVTLVFRISWRTPFFLSSEESRSDFSTDTVPTSTGCPVLCRSSISLAELLVLQANRLVAETDIPHTLLLGESPDGSNATGNSTSQQWYNFIGTEQENYLRPKLQRLMDLIVPDEKSSASNSNRCVS